MDVVGLATWHELPTLSEDDRLLAEALRRSGVAVEPVVWSDPDVRWDRLDLIILRSTWDYHFRIAEFLQWLDLVSSRTELRNVPGLVRWNSHKGYLRDLERRGVPVVPTVWGSEIESAVEVARERRWRRWVLKPAVSAGGHGAAIFGPETSQSAEARFHELRSRGEVLIQPYVDEVERTGEHSLVYLGGEYSHAVIRAPKLAGRSTLQEGDPVEPTAAEVSAAGRALKALDEPTLYARVDLVGDEGSTPRVMELELIEPALFLGTRAGAAEHLATAIRNELIVR